MRYQPLMYDKPLWNADQIWATVSRKVLFRHPFGVPNSRHATIYVSSVLFILEED